MTTTGSGPTAESGPTAGSAAAGEPFPLARLFAIAYRQLITDLHAELAVRGWTDVRPAYGFALLALRDGPMTSGELSATLGMTKQAGSKLVESLLAAGYIERAQSAADARARPVQLSERGRELQATAEAIYSELEQRWAAVIGADRLAGIRHDLTAVVRQTDGELPAVRPLW